MTDSEFEEKALHLLDFLRVELHFEGDDDYGINLKESTEFLTKYLCAVSPQIFEVLHANGIVRSKHSSEKDTLQ